ncbi:MAG TPA: molybdate ABC transporter permease subunit [Rhizomicrobium sp.]|nr:molybdate ABC transporter permease subunit [Rhizomicrobium sp.]
MTPLTPAETEALLLSLRVSSVAIACTFPPAFAAALFIARKTFPGRGLVDGILHLPLALPPVVIGYLLLMIFGTREPFGAWLETHWGIRFAFSWTGAALAAGLMTFPFQYRAIRLSLETQDAGLIQAAETLGASAFDRFLSVTFPLALPGVVAGLITAFSASLGEFGAIITFVSNIPGETRTLPLAIYSALQQPGGETEAARLSAISITLALIGVACAGLADRRLNRALRA